MSRLYHIPYRNEINLDLEEFSEIVNPSDVCFYTDAGCSILEEFPTEKIIEIIKNL